MKVVIVDRNEIAAYGLLHIITNNFPECDVIRHAASGKAAIELLQDETFDLAIIDTDINDAPYDKVVKAAIDKHGNTLIIAKFNTPRHKAATHCVSKPYDASIFNDFTREQICNVVGKSIDSMKNNEHKKRKGIRGRVNANSCNTTDYPSVNVRLSSREMTVLECLARGMTSKEIAKELFVSTNTVNTHRQHLLDKFCVHNVVDLITKAIAKGYIKV